MTEREMEDLLWEYPEKFLNEPLQKFARQPTSPVGRADLIFVDRLARLLVVEIKRDTLERGAIGQLRDYYGMMKHRFPERAVELMVIAARIPPERRLSCEQQDIIAVEIPQKKYRDVAAEVGYEFKSETSVVSPGASITHQNTTHDLVPGHDERAHSKVEKAWYYWKSNDRGYFLAFVNARGSCSIRRFDARDGRALEKAYRSGRFQENFASYLRSAARLNVDHQPNLEHTCKFHLPETILADLQSQIAACK